ncbi:1-hydroxy-2-methyl-2-butenyl 4-diphosphate reductase [Streptomyces sp. NPDC091292]|uniref:phosphorylase family protein n=1 Tax=Streptomyces sp. NPDC091292 TaxID=3365991 RepID=UPI003816CA3A
MAETPASPGTPPLLIACALGIEHLALRSGSRGSTPVPMTLLRTGMGPGAAERAVARALAGEALRGAAVVATGFCAGLAPGMHPGDLVVAEETRLPSVDGGSGATTGRTTPTGTTIPYTTTPYTTTSCTGTELLVKELAGALPGRTVHTGPLIGSDHVVRGHERAALLATGAIAVDMESAATLRTAVAAGSRPVAAVRVVVDAPEHELVRIGTVRGGISAFRVLRAVLPAFFEWHRNAMLPRR